MSVGFWQIILIIGVFVLLFGGRRIPQLMRDIGSGIRSFRQAMNNDSSDDKSN